MVLEEFAHSALEGVQRIRIVDLGEVVVEADRQPRIGHTNVQRSTFIIEEGGNSSQHTQTQVTTTFALLYVPLECRFEFDLGTFF